MTSVAKLELESITDFQREIHLNKEKDEGISSIFYHEFRKSTWYTHIHARLKCTADDENLEFMANTTFHYLKYTYMVTELPEIRVKPQYEGQYKICWTHNVGSNIIESGDFQVDDDYFVGFDRQWMDIQSQFYMKPGFRDHYNMCVGNLNFLEEWSNHLPRYKTTVPQPWYYSIDTGYAFPLYYCNSESKVVHNYQMRTKISDLLRMVVYKEELNAWVELPAVDFTVLEGANALTKLKTPELWGCYAYITEDEISFNKCQNERVFYINDVIACDASNPPRTDWRLKLVCTAILLARLCFGWPKISMPLNSATTPTTPPIPITCIEVGIPSIASRSNTVKRIESKTWALNTLSVFRPGTICPARLQSPATIRTRSLKIV
jgi:hypothetical protein